MLSVNLILSLAGEWQDDASYMYAFLINVPFI